MKRRNFIKAGALSATGIAASCTTNTGTVQAKKALRAVHITDMHIYPDAVVEKGIKNLISEINQLQEKPDIIINTGDNIMDALKRSKEEVAAQWDVWHKYFRSQINFELYNCIGNHDVWGWGLNDEKVKNDKLYGKAWAKENLELENNYYSVNKNAWKFVFLDSSFFAENRHVYTAKLDEKQFVWLENELANTSKEVNVCIVSHIPILSPAVFFDGDNEKSGNWEIPGSWMHIDARKIKDLFLKTPNVKTAISGHVHLVDHANYLNVDYYCNGAASGGWWKGNYQEFAPLYAIIDFYEDGSVDTQLINYNWK